MAHAYRNEDELFKAMLTSHPLPTWSEWELKEPKDKRTRQELYKKKNTHTQ